MKKSVRKGTRRVSRSGTSGLGDFFGAGIDGNLRLAAVAFFMVGISFLWLITNK